MTDALLTLSPAEIAELRYALNIVLGRAYRGLRNQERGGPPSEAVAILMETLRARIAVSRGILNRLDDLAGRAEAELRMATPVTKACHDCKTASPPVLPLRAAVSKTLHEAGWLEKYVYYPDPDHPERTWLRHKRWFCPACLEKKWTAGKPE
jgi:hypothetical protein